jgi:peptide/nickel transport system substrate-binding protein
VLSASGRATTLVPGVNVVNAAGETVAFDGAPLQMSRLTVDFTFQPLVWSDGTPVTAGDSVFSFEVAADRDTPRQDNTVDFTESYTALDEQSVRWVGLPGYVDTTYFNNVWTPLPRHQLESFAAAEFLEAPETTQTPLSHGPFVVEEWTPGEAIRLTPNPHYYRADEELPHLTSLTFRFISPELGSDPVQLIAALTASRQAGNCDILTNDLVSLEALPAFVAAEAEGGLITHVVNGDVFEHIVFGINPVFEYANDRPDWFEDVRVRQAIALCTNRQRMADELMGSRVAVMDTFVPNEHPLHPPDAAQWPYDPERANALLDEIGYLDSDGDGFRQDVTAGVPFSITLGTDNASALRAGIIQMAKEDLAGCGINANTFTLPPGSWFAEGPAGRLFGRRFDLAEFAWVNRIQPNCGLYLSGNITGPEGEGFGGWNNVNVSGWANDAYDAACRQALALLPGTPGYEENHQQAMRLFAQELPALPLFPSLKAAVTNAAVLNFQLDPTQPSELWNVARLDMELDS